MKLFIICFICLWSRPILAQSNNRHLICKDVQDIFSVHEEENGMSTVNNMRQGRPGRVGPKGEPGFKGLPGLIGPRGPPGNVDYERISTTIDDKVDRSIFDAEIARLNEKIEELSARLQELENVDNGTCKLKFQGKCYWAVMQVVNFNDAVKLCGENSGYPANVYKSQQFDAILQYTRQSIPSNAIQTYLWLGMRADPTNEAVYLSNGDPAPYLRWRPGAPRFGSRYTNIFFYANKDVNSAEQGLCDWGPSNRRQGVLCEK